MDATTDNDAKPEAREQIKIRKAQLDNFNTRIFGEIKLTRNFICA